MTITSDLAGKGKVLRVFDAKATGRSGTTGGEDVATLVFHPLDTNYEHHLVAGAGYDGPVGRHVRGVVRVRGRKVYSVPSGGLFVQPVIGTPRIIQGRVLSLDASTLVVRAGATFVVELPDGPDAIDLHAGDIRAGSMVNVVAWPGAEFALKE